jgi:PAS domain S-box-containing protein
MPVKTKKQPSLRFLPSKKNSFKDIFLKYRLLSDLMHHIPDVIYFKDTKGRLVMVNQAHAKGLNLKPEEVIGKTDFDIFPQERAVEMAKDDRLVMTTKRPIIDKIERATRPDGIDNYVSTTKIPRFDEKGRVIGLMGITRDITHRMQLQRLKEEKDSMEKRLLATEEINRMKSELVSVVSHELRIPLTIAKEAISLITDGTAGYINNKQQGLLKKAKENLERLRRIIEDLLDISRIEKGTLRLHYSLVNLNDLLRESSDFFKKWARGKKINLNYILPKSEINVFIDAERILQAISNLISNAIKFTEEGGRITVELKAYENKVRFAVMDTGTGLSKRELPKLFKRFVQLHKKDGLEKKGLGLGLYITKEIIERHGGEIWCESKIGIGSRFYFTLPGLYTTDTLDKQNRESINELLKKHEITYLINLSIINYPKFKKVIKIHPKKIFIALEDIIKDVIKKTTLSDTHKPEMIIRDFKNGVFGIVYPETTENKATHLCNTLKNKIERHFIDKKIKNVFINVGILSFSLDKKLSTTRKLLTNVYVKKMFVGSEVRRFRRFNYKSIVEISNKDKTLESSQTIDISEGGLCFLSNKPLETDTKINIKLALSHSKKISLKGRVAWKKEIEENLRKHPLRYKIGLEFINLKIKDKRNISKLIKSLS